MNNRRAGTGLPAIWAASGGQGRTHRGYTASGGLRMLGAQRSSGPGCCWERQGVTVKALGLNLRSHKLCVLWQDT